MSPKQKAVAVVWGPMYVVWIVAEFATRSWLGAIGAILLMHGFVGLLVIAEEAARRGFSR